MGGIECGSDGEPGVCSSLGRKGRNDLEGAAKFVSKRGVEVGEGVSSACVLSFLVDLK
jgi:hypothetical protein